MDPVKTLFDSFDVFAAVPGGVQKLRELILQLAVQGKLVPQDPDDEPASMLLERISKIRIQQKQQSYPNENEASVQAKKQKKQSLPDGLSPLPSGWKWATLMQCASLVVDCHNKTAPYSESGIPLLRTSNIRDGKLLFSNLRFVTPETYKRWSMRCFPEPGDILLTREAPMGEVCIIPDDLTVCMGQRMMLIRLAQSTIVPQFLLYSLRDPNLMNRVQDKPVGATVQHLRVGGVETLLVQVPPEAEQHRIVAKVDQLMTLCDELETKYTAKQTKRQRLNEAALDALLSAQNQSDFDQAWQRVAEHFDLLYDVPESVPKLRQAILQLAVQGKLVPQGPNDEPASVLLEKIKVEKDRLVKEGKIKKQKTLPPIEAGEVPFEVPAGWVWVRLQDLLIFGPRNGYSPKPVEGPTPTKTLALGATTYGEFDASQFKYIDEDIPNDSHLWLDDGDVLIQRGNTIDYVGIAAVYHGTAKEFVYPDLMMKMKCSWAVQVDYLHRAINCSASREYFKRHASGTSGTMPKVNQSVVNGLPVPLPPCEEQKRILSKFGNLILHCRWFF
jgi:type I restriction enzyme, S subunit